MVSIIVTHKQCLLYLKDCLKSISEQEFKDYETVLVVDDLQDDPQEFQAVIEEYKDKVNLKLYYLEKKTGVAAARNLGLDKAQGEYIYFLDNDDYIYDDGIKKLLNIMDEDTDMAYGRIQGTYQGTVTFEEKRDLGMYVEIENQKYEITLEDNDTVTEFKKLLPLELSLSELNGNEKYFYLDATLPIREEEVKEIKAGDVMLYGDNCLVIFYQSFSTVYSYTKIGHIDNLPTLDKNTLNVKITLE